MKAEKEARNRQRGRRRRKPWLSAGSLSTLIIWMRTNSSMTRLCLLVILISSSINSGLSCVCSGRRLVSFGSGWWVWRPRSLISARNLKDKNMTWVNSSSVFIQICTIPSFKVMVSVLDCISSTAQAPLAFKIITKTSCLCRLISFWVESRIIKGEQSTLKMELWSNLSACKSPSPCHMNYWTAD